jgi:putative ABC transport system permease protein
LGITPSVGVSDDELVRRVNATTPELEALTRADAAKKAPSVTQVSRSFLLIFLLYGLVVPLVVGLFFLIVTVQKARSLTLLRAIGARGSTLVGALIVQVVVVVGLGVAVGTALYVPVSQQRIGSIPLRFDPVAVLAWGVLILLLGLVSALFSARRIARIEPAEALSGGAT